MYRKLRKITKFLGLGLGLGQILFLGLGLGKFEVQNPRPRSKSAPRSIPASGSTFLGFFQSSRRHSQIWALKIRIS